VDSVTGSSSLGSGESRMTIFIALYRLAVRKVVFSIEGMSGTSTKTFRPHVAKVPNGQSRGIPKFRYFAAPFKGEICVRKVTLLDGSGGVIYSEPRPACPDGGNL
jgi:hypothetical protein